MAVSSLFRLAVVVLILFALAMSSSMAWGSFTDADAMQQPEEVSESPVLFEQ